MSGFWSLFHGFLRQNARLGSLRLGTLFHSLLTTVWLFRKSLTCAELNCLFIKQKKVMKPSCTWSHIIAKKHPTHTRPSNSLSTSCTTLGDISNLILGQNLAEDVGMTPFCLARGFMVECFWDGNCKDKARFQNNVKCHPPYSLNTGKQRIQNVIGINQ